MEAMQGLLTPLILFVISVAPTVTAPVLPAETNASPLPSLSSLKPTAILESAFSLSTDFASSVIVITPFVSTISVFLSVILFSLTHLLILSSSPTRIISTPNSSTASIEPFMISRGALSPPNASTIIFIYLSSLLTHLLLFRQFLHSVLFYHGFSAQSAEARRNLRPSAENSLLFHHLCILTEHLSLLFWAR